ATHLQVFLRELRLARGPKSGVELRFHGDPGEQRGQLCPTDRVRSLERLGKLLERLRRSKRIVCLARRVQRMDEGSHVVERKRTFLPRHLGDLAQSLSSFLGHHGRGSWIGSMLYGTDANLFENALQLVDLLGPQLLLDLLVVKAIGGKSHCLQGL